MCRNSFSCCVMRIKASARKKPIPSSKSADEVKVQLSYLFRRGVVRPLDDCAAQQMAAFHVNGPIRVEWIPILSDDEFAVLWEAGLLQRINEACGLGISDYEECELPADKTEVAVRTLRSEPEHAGSVSTFCKLLDALLSDALASNRNVYFIF